MTHSIERLTCARIPTAAGDFQLCYYSNNLDNKEHLALVVGDVAQQASVMVRVHSECFTGDVLGSLRCDCGPQLQQAMQRIAAEGSGVIIYLRQEGRGIGLLDKLRAYNLQDAGYDTVDANLMLGHQADARDYSLAAMILKDLGVRSARLLTNNPSKIESLQALGVAVTERVPLETDVTSENAAYLKAKVTRMRHLLNLEKVKSKNGSVRPWLRSQHEYPPRNGRPFVTLSYAQSLDGALTTKQGVPTNLSGPEAMTMTHRLRANHDAILVGIGAVRADNPGLTVRLVDGDDPQPVILDSRLRFPANAKLLLNPKKPWIFTTNLAPANRYAPLEDAGARVICLASTANGRVDLAVLLATLAEMDIKTVMVEGGAAIITSFLTARLVDQLVLTIAPRWLGGLNALTQTAPHFSSMNLDNLRYQQMGRDLIVTGSPKWSSA